MRSSSTSTPSARPRIKRSTRRQLRVYAECWKSINRLPYQRYCDPSYDWSERVHNERAPRSLAEVPRALTAAIIGSGLPAWMLPRQLGRWGAPSEADDAAMAAASEWRKKAGYVVEAFTDAPNRPPWRDRILRSSGYVEARLLCTFGAIEFQADAPHRWAPPAAAERQEAPVLLRPGQSVALSIGRYHSIRVVGEETSASWLYIMR